ncbi:hypothetical protein pVa21_032 [Vibrio phage pVa-21]|nr:hypothetical protein pVa21_032 [Vibrio phage pVa-21]
MTNYVSTLNQLINELTEDGIEGIKYDLQGAMNDEKKAALLVKLAEAIDAQNDLVQNAQQELNDEVIVQLGNESDTDGATLAKGEIIKITLNILDKPLYYIATPKGIAVAEKCRGKLNIFYSTHCMPVSYAEWIERNWNINVEDHLETIERGEVLADNVKSSDVMRKAIKEAVSLQD